MATSVRLIRRYVWLADTVRSAGRVTLSEINARWRNSNLNDMGEDEIPERTFHRHREAILDLFGIEIVCDRVTNEYHIANPGEEMESGIASRLFNVLAIDNRISGNRDIERRILFEKAPGGEQHLGVIIEGISQKRRMRVRYRKFSASTPREMEIAPYGIRQWRQRWYLLGLFEGCGRLTPFGLDRILDIELLGDEFEFSDEIDICDYFSDVIGTNLDPDYDCESVVVRIYGLQRNYIDTVPLHHSQQKIKETPEYSDYEFRLRPEWEFQHELLRLGPDAEVLSPEWLRSELRSLTEQTLDRYKT